MARLSEIHPLFYHLRIWQKRSFRHIGNLWQTQQLAQEKSLENLGFSCKKHQSLLRRKLGNSDPQLQENKVINLTIAHRQIDGVLIHPGQIFSFWHLVGEATAKRGYVEGMQLSRGEVKTGVGGGLCQLANLLYWMALHTPLEIVERHHHSFDPFPDDHRVLPFGSGAGIFYNYVDLRFANPTNQTFQIRVWLTQDHLKGAIYTDREWAYSYHVFERHHQFLQQNGKNYRANEIWRSVIDKRTGNLVREELLIKNFAEVKYSLNDAQTLISNMR
ncbi:MAG TPA: VanW family protein [Microcoleaceae cyanobacterium]|jgi:vancomycin resistance protein VanW